MKTFIVYGLLFLLPFVIFTMGEESIVHFRHMEKAVGESRTDTGLCYDSPDFLFDNDCGEIVLDLNHFTSDYKFFTILSDIRKPGRDRDIKSVLFFAYFSNIDLPAKRGYYIFGLHRIIV